jgi:hypothetical protein
VNGREGRKEVFKKAKYQGQSVVFPQNELSL